MGSHPGRKTTGCPSSEQTHSCPRRVACSFSDGTAGDARRRPRGVGQAEIACKQGDLNTHRMDGRVYFDSEVPCFAEHLLVSLTAFLVEWDF